MAEPVRKTSQTSGIPAGIPAGIRRQGGGAAASRFAPVVKARDTRGTIKKLFLLYVKEGKRLFAVFLLLLGSTVALLNAPNLIGKIVNAIDGSGGDNAAIHGMIQVLLALYICDWIFATVQGYIIAGASQKAVRALRRGLFAKMQRLALVYHDTHTHGELMSRLTNDIDNISGTIAASTSQLMNSAVMVFGSMFFMVRLSPVLSAVTLITLPLVLMLTKGIAKKSKAMFIGQQRELGKLNGVIEENISGLRMVKAFNQESENVNKFDKINSELLNHSSRAQIWSGFLMPMMNVITNVGYTFIAIVGCILAVNGKILPGTIVSFIAYSRQFVRPLNDIAGTFNSLQSALAGAERVFDVMSEAEETKDKANAVELTDAKGIIEFRDVCFGYVDGVNVLKNVSFKVNHGQTVALVGKTGAGKTTIVNLLTRFYDISSGSITIDGRDIREYTRDSLRKAFTVVLQDTCLFTGTIAENIKYGRPEASDVEVIEASKAANSFSFIKRLPQGYDTMVSGAVDTLSQGQRQLIAITRAVLCPAPVLILDEATSNVDTKTEKKIQQALLRFKSGRTSFVIAHRLSTIKDADVIMVIDDGMIIESGTHAELLNLDGTYAVMYNSQMSGI